MSTDRRVYRTLVVLYPKAFRDEFTPDLAQAFSELVRDHGRANAWRRTVVDLAVTVPRYRLEATMNTRKPNAALNLLIVALAVAGLGTLAIGAFVGLPLLALAVFLGVTQRSQLARSLRPEGPSSRRRSRLITAAVLGVIALGAIASWMYHINHYNSLGDTTVMVHGLIGYPALVGALGYLVAGLLTPNATPKIAARPR